MTRRQGYLLAGGLSVLITVPVALLVLQVFGLAAGVAYGFLVSAGCSWWALWRWRRQGHRFADDPPAPAGPDWTPPGWRSAQLAAWRRERAQLLQRHRWRE